MASSFRRSRHGLTVCTGCRVHIRAADTPSGTVCPFCGATLTFAERRFAVPSGRAGLLAASLFAFSASACGSSEARPEPTTQPAPDEEEEPPPDEYDPADDPTMVEAYGIAPDEDPDENQFRDDDEDPPDEPMYGVPP